MLKNAGSAQAPETACNCVSQIRNRGAIGGSLALADPAAELPVIAVALNVRRNISAIWRGSSLDAR